MDHCEICYCIDIGKLEDEAICDVCELRYCEDCSYMFTIHYQHYGHRCYLCSEQYRRVPLTKELVRDLKIKFILNGGSL